MSTKAISTRFDELWRELVRMSRSNPMTLRRVDYRDGLFTAYCIVTDMSGEEVYERLQKELAEEATR